MAPKASKAGEGRTPLNTKKAASGSSSEGKKTTPRKKATPQKERTDSPAPSHRVVRQPSKTGSPEPGAASRQAAPPAAPAPPAAAETAAGSLKPAKVAEAVPEAASSSAAAKEPPTASPPSGKAGGAGRKGKKGEPPKKEEKNKIDLSSGALRSMANELDALAAKHVEMGGSLNTIASKCGEVLERKMTGGMKSKEFFEVMDKNGDGKISKMEFRQAMRDLGLMGESSGYNAKDVDSLFGELDKDGGGDLDMSELSKALKELRLRAQSVSEQEVVAKEKAEYWRGRAESTREAAGKVEEWEAAVLQLQEVRANPTPESKLGALIMKRGLKPADILTALAPDSKRQADIDEETFSIGIIGLGVECTREELGLVFGRLDADGGGTLDYEELKEAIKDLSEAKNVAVAHEKALAKKVVGFERDAKDAQMAIKQQLLEDEKKKAAEAEAKAKAEEEERQAAEAVEAAAKAREEAKSMKKKQKEEEFEKKIAEKRNNRDDIHAAMDKMIAEENKQRHSAVAIE